MEYSGQYLTFNEYKAMGGTLDQTPFNILELKARQEINKRTQKQLSLFTLWVSPAKWM